MGSKNFQFLLYLATAFYFLSLLFFLAKKERGSFILLVLGFSGHTGYLISRGWISGIFIPFPVFEGVFFVPWAIAFLIMVRRIKDKEDSPWLSAVSLVVFFSFFSLINPKGIELLGPNKLTAWASIYLFIEGMARACFYCAGWFAFLNLLKRTKAETFHGLVVWGFILYTGAQVFGVIWCYLGWAASFQWVYVHLEAAAIWCFYANYLHLRFLPAWNARGKAWYVVVGFFLVFLAAIVGYFVHFQAPRIGK